MGKCDKCNKNITKNKPGLECSRCEKIVHLNTTCSELTNKQMAAVRAADNLEWACRECRELSPKRNTIIVPEDDDEEEKYDEASELKIDIKQLLADISKEMEKTIKREMKEFTQSLQFHSEKMDEVIANLEACQGTINDLKRKNIELTYKNNNLETRVAALEQRLQEKEQQDLSKYVEICNVPQCKDENIIQLVQQIAKRLKLPADDIQQATRLPGKEERHGIIKVQLQSELSQSVWIAASKSKENKISISDIDPTTQSDKVMYIRELLTPYNKNLLWYTKKELSGTYKYIWVKKGIIRARKGEKERAVIIRSREDVNKLK